MLKISTDFLSAQFDTQPEFCSTWHCLALCLTSQNIHKVQSVQLAVWEIFLFSELSSILQVGLKHRVESIKILLKFFSWETAASLPPNPWLFSVTELLLQAEQCCAVHTPWCSTDRCSGE